MTLSRKPARGTRAFAFPLFGVAVLLLCYWVLAGWHDVPALIGGALGSIHWPR